jgi:Zn-dependent protease
MLVFAMVAHEYAHALTALQQGDDTAYNLGRVTLNPVPHIDPWMSLLLPTLLWFGSGGRFTFGGARPVPVNSRKFRHFVRGDLIVSAAGVTTNLFLSVVFAVLFILLGLVARSAPGAAAAFDTAQRMMVYGIWLNLVLCFFNLIPIPPLDGSHILYHLLPGGIRKGYRAIQRLGFLPLLALLLLLPPSATRVLLTPAYAGLALFLRLATPFAVGTNWNIFPS